MAVKGVRSGQRLLDVLEGVATHQPIGVSDLSRALEEEKSTVQRMLQTLAQAGWIRPATGAGAKWEMSSRIHMVAHKVRGVGQLCANARPALAELRDATGETVVLALREKTGFIVADVAESPNEWRIVPRVGIAVPDRLSACAMAVLPFLSKQAQTDLIGMEPDTALGARTREQGYAVQESERGGGSVNLAAPIFDAAGTPLAAIVLSVPAVRLAPERYATTGEKVAQVADRLSWR